MTETLPPTKTPSSQGVWYSLLAIAVGLFLTLSAMSLTAIDVNFPFVRLFVYSGVAALFAGIGSTAAVKYDLPIAGQAASAGGAAAIAVLLCWTIGIDPPSRLSMTYYINFPDQSAGRIPEDFKATVEFISEGKIIPEKTTNIPILRAPGGNTLKFNLVNVSSSDSIIVRLHNSKEQKTWASAAILATESFMNLNEEPR